MTKPKGALDALRGSTQYRCPCGEVVVPSRHVYRGRDGHLYRVFWQHNVLGRCSSRQVVGQRGPRNENIHDWLSDRGMTRSLIVFEEYVDDE